MAIESQHLGTAGVVSSQHIYNSAVLSQHLGAGAVLPQHAAYLEAVFLGPIKASASNVVFTKDSCWSASSINSSAAPGTAVDFPRNLVYRLTPNTASSSLYSGGSIVAVGSDIAGNAITETVAVTALNTVSAGIVGTKCFGSVGTVSFSNVTIHTASSSASTAFSINIGVGNIVGLANSVQSTNAVPYAWIGTGIQNGSYTVQTGAVPTAGISFSNALGSGSNVLAYRQCSL